MNIVILPVALALAKARTEIKPLSIGDVCGQGLTPATEFARDGQPDKEAAKAAQQACLKRQ